MVRDARIHAVGGGAAEVMLEEVAKRLKGSKEDHHMTAPHFDSGHRRRHGYPNLEPSAG